MLFTLSVAHAAVITVGAAADHATISDALAAAADGDVIRIGPGDYDEHVVVDRDVVLSGNGDRADIVLRNTGPEDEVVLATAPLAPLAETTDARLFLLVLEQDLSTEDSEVLLELLSRRRAPELVDGILASSAFSRLADPASGTAGFLALALGKLAAGDGPRTFAAATQLMKSAGAVDRVQRLRNACL